MILFQEDSVNQPTSHKSVQCNIAGIDTLRILVLRDFKAGDG